MLGEHGVLQNLLIGLGAENSITLGFISLLVQDFRDDFVVINFRSVDTSVAS